MTGAFRLLALAAVLFGAVYAVLGALHLAQGRGDGGLLLGFGLAAVAVGTVLLHWAGRRPPPA